MTHLKCPKCSIIVTVYHMDWSALVCLGCKTEVKQEAWLPAVDQDSGDTDNEEGHPATIHRVCRNIYNALRR